MTQHSSHDDEPTSGFGGFLLFAGFLLAAFALVIGLLAFTNLVAEQGATGAQNTIDAIAVFTVPLLLTALLLVFLGLALDLRRMARTMHDTAEHAVDAVEEFTHHSDTNDHDRRVIPVVTIPERDTRQTDRTTPQIRSPGASYGGPTGSPAAMPRGVGAGTRHMHVPRTASGTNAPPWSGGPGTPPPGPEPGPQPPQWQGQSRGDESYERTQPSWQDEREGTNEYERTRPHWQERQGANEYERTRPHWEDRGHGAGEHQSAKPEPWRHSSVDIRPRS